MDIPQSTRCAKIWLLHLKHSCGRKGSLSLNVIREICAFLPDFSGFLPQVTTAFLRFFSCLTSTWGPKVHLRTSIKADQYSSWIALEDVCSAAEDLDKVWLTFSPGRAPWTPCLTCSLLGIVTELFNCEISTCLEDVRFKQTAPPLCTIQTKQQVSAIQVS